MATFGSATCKLVKKSPSFVGIHCESPTSFKISTMLKACLAVGTTWPWSSVSWWAYNLTSLPAAFFAAANIDANVSMVSTEPPNAKQNNESDLGHRGIHKKSHAKPRRERQQNNDTSEAI